MFFFGSGGIIRDGHGNLSLLQGDLGDLRLSLGVDRHYKAKGREDR